MMIESLVSQSPENGENRKEATTHYLLLRNRKTAASNITHKILVRRPINLEDNQEDSQQMHPLGPTDSVQIVN